MEILQALKRKLDADEPSAGQLRRASVAVTLKDPESPSMLLIKRADRVGDPWSGQVAFPGGKAQEGDSTLKDTAIRETREEVGIDLGQDAKFLGYFAPFRTHTGTLDVFPAVFLLKKNVEMRPNEEVSSYRWVKLGKLSAGQARSSYRVNAGGQTRELPALIVEGYAVWGLTHRIISSLLS
jgi:8-oxo-dGTP pyrophosphatase MutT (NUDIX family)